MLLKPRIETKMPLVIHGGPLNCKKSCQMNNLVLLFWLGVRGMLALKGSGYWSRGTVRAGMTNLLATAGLVRFDKVAITLLLGKGRLV